MRSSVDTAGRHDLSRRPLRWLASCLALGLAAWLAAAEPAHAQEVVPAPLDERQQILLLDVERYFNAINSLKADFLQIAPEGGVAEGVFYLRRPGRLRVEYAPPVPVLIVGDGFLLHYHDMELGQVNDWPIFDTPLGALSSESVRFNQDLVVTEFAERANRLEITVVQREDPGLGSLTLVFEQGPLQLRQWRVTDAQGLITTVSLLGVETNIALSAKLFVFDDPRERPIGR